MKEKRRDSAEWQGKAAKVREELARYARVHRLAYMAVKRALFPQGGRA